MQAECIELEQRREVQSVGIHSPFNHPIALVVAEPRDRAASVSDFELAAASVVSRIGDHLAQCVGHRGSLTVLVVRILRHVAAAVDDVERLTVTGLVGRDGYSFGRRHFDAAVDVVVRVGRGLPTGISGFEHAGKGVVLAADFTVQRVGHFDRPAIVLVAGRRDFASCVYRLGDAAEGVVDGLGVEV